MVHASQVGEQQTIRKQGNEMNAMLNSYKIKFEHTSGGDSLLPKEDRGFFSGYMVDIQTESTDIDEIHYSAMKVMYEMVESEHPTWLMPAIDDLMPEITMKNEKTFVYPE